MIRFVNGIWIWHHSRCLSRHWYSLRCCFSYAGEWNWSQSARYYYFRFDCSLETFFSKLKVGFRIPLETCCCWYSPRKNCLISLCLGLSHSTGEAGKNKTQLDAHFASLRKAHFAPQREEHDIVNADTLMISIATSHGFVDTKVWRLLRIVVFIPRKSMRAWISRSKLAEIKGIGESKLEGGTFHTPKHRSKANFCCKMKRFSYKWYTCLSRLDHNFLWLGCVWLEWSWMSPGNLCFVNFHVLLENHEVWHINWIGCALCQNGFFIGNQQSWLRKWAVFRSTPLCMCILVVFYCASREIDGSNYQAGLSFKYLIPHLQNDPS